ncbi:kinase-like protein [Dothidotthia symphoricarpi CBS 119687]|uniref:mitogen-activated protein kinase kinase n=1 Tax=Dothidotthia symphoricarpi CBS 119687 TaxID=1392245 RepID=A0A6A6A6D3_9PLEO|nr:kinase-like protein [Dothidotthia symphoricarpi CBS 119687]KAF2126328.1 kinase-like protein [Dothidotthia symphoricarpi CBS 119687]
MNALTISSSLLTAPPPDLPPILRIEQGDDHIVPDGTQLPYEHVGILGFGHSGTVEKVRDKTTGEVYARKIMHMRGRKHKAQTELIFSNEVRIIRSLNKHHHIIHVFATYMTRREVGLILLPVADAPRIALMRHVLEQAFGCLANALAFIHLQQVRHKDIKPQNILIDHGRVIYTDFGYSLDHSQLSRSTTEGRPDALTRRYSAPEVLAYEHRNSSSDVFSLGCVFLEIMSALTDGPDLYPNQGSYSEILDDIHEQLGLLILPPRLVFLPNIIATMIEHGQIARPEASQVSEAICGAPGCCCVECYQATTQAERKCRHVREENKSIDASMQAGNPAPASALVNQYPSGTVTTDWLWTHPRNDDLLTNRKTAGQTLESFYQSFRLIPAKDREFWRLGRVFATLKFEPVDFAGNYKFNTDMLSTVTFNDMYSVRYCFVVVGVDRGHVVHTSQILPCGSYPTMRIGVNPIAYFTGTDSATCYSSGEFEHGMNKEPVQIEPAEPSLTMNPKCRIQIRKTFGQTMNGYVKDIGTVLPEHLNRLLSYIPERSHGFWNVHGAVSRQSD